MCSETCSYNRAGLDGLLLHEVQCFASLLTLGGCVVVWYSCGDRLLASVVRNVTIEPVRRCRCSVMRLSGT